jgi:hypothetical protein
MWGPQLETSLTSTSPALAGLQAFFGIRRDKVGPLISYKPIAQCGHLEIESQPALPTTTISRSHEGVLANRTTRVAPDNAFITFMGSGRRLSGTSLVVMDNVGCPYGTLGVEGKQCEATST